MEFIVLLNEENRRLDNFLRKKFTKTSLSLIYKLIRTHKIKINNAVILDPKYKVQINDAIFINDNDIKLLSEEKKSINLSKKEVKDFEIILENKDILIINKPPFTSVHGFSNCLDNQVKDFLIKRDGNENIYVTHIHRLDKDTTGCIIYAKNLATAKYLLNNLSDIKKVYLCITSKPFLQKSFVQEGYIKYVTNKVVTCDSDNGKLFRQKIKFCQKITNNMFLQKIYLFTGRKHQIRYGCALLKNPIVGEKVYTNYSSPNNDANKEYSKYLYLHAYALIFSKEMCEKLNLKQSEFLASFPFYWDHLFKKTHFTFQPLQLI